MNPAVKTGSAPDPFFDRRAKEIEDRLIKLIDAGADLAAYYHRTRLPMPAKNLRPGHALVIGDGGFRCRIPVPSREYDQYSSARNALVVRFGGAGSDVVIRLMDVTDHPQRQRPASVPMPPPVPMRPAIVVRPQYA